MSQISQNEPEEVKVKADWLREFHRSTVGFCVNFGIAHFFGLIGLVLIAQGRVMTSTLIFAYILAEFASYSITIGCHRLFSHRTFKATRPLVNFLAVCNFFAGQQSIWLWSAWHRVHHKCVDTDEDPHNATRGFFYSHIGWLLTYDHQKFLKSLDKIDMSDLEKVPIIMFHERYYMYIHHTCIYILPTVIPWYFFAPPICGEINLMTHQ
ncbi:unnamed protein product [Allacma fusca]|uniref:Fatty acid desaturase domain-containing protein n=1 Tax=Allacma fusca TaxID=39272 RepID=A0A8J2JLH8_9HEXA|nr:unnamed protein product [Allacma fusca]